MGRDEKNLHGVKQMMKYIEDRFDWTEQQWFKDCVENFRRKAQCKMPRKRRKLSSFAVSNDPPEGFFSQPKETYDMDSTTAHHGADHNHTMEAEYGEQQAGSSVVLI